MKILVAVSGSPGCARARSLYAGWDGCDVVGVPVPEAGRLDEVDIVACCSFKMSRDFDLSLVTSHNDSV